MTAPSIREALKHALASLVAAISLLERTPRAKKAAPSDKMFDQMIADYKAAIEQGRAALAAEGYVVAPREPTTQQMEAAGNAVAEYAKKMTQAGGDVDAMDYALRAVIYRAMIAAAQEISNASD